MKLIASLGNLGGVVALITTIFGSDQKAVKIAVSLIGLLVAGFVVVSDYLFTNPFGASRTKELEDLVQSLAEAETVAMKLEIWVESDAPRGALPQELVDRAAVLVAAFIKARNA